MLSYLAERLVKMRKVAGVHVQILADGTRHISVVVLEQKKNNVSIITENKDIELDVLSDIVQENIPVVLSIDGRGVLHRRSPRREQSSPQELLATIFPNSKLNEFVIHLSDSGDEVFTSLARTSVVRDVIDSISSQGLCVVQLVLGPFAVSLLSPLLESSGITKINTCYSLVEIKDGFISAMATANEGEQVYSLGEDNICSSLLTPYAGAMGLFLGSEPQKEVTAVNSVKFLKDNWYQKRLFQVSLRAVLGILLLVLLVNAFFFLQYSKENESVLVEANLNKAAFQQLSKLKEEVLKNKAFVELAGWNRSTPGWFYADRLGASLHSTDIVLTDLFIHPFDEKAYKSDRKVVFTYSSIAIKGKCQKPSSLNNWLDLLRKEDWVDEVVKQSYQYDDYERTGMFSFEIKIKE